MSSNAKTVGELPEGLRSHLLKHGVPAETQLKPLKEGGNNQVNRLSGREGDFVLKRYFQHPEDPRDRFGAERSFYTFLWDCEFRQVPEPCAWDAENRMGLFKFVAGRKLAATEVTKSMVEQALQFAIGMNRFRGRANKIPVASEAYFSAQEQVEGIARRVAAAQQIQGELETSVQAAAFARNELMPAWTRVAGAIANQLASDKDLTQPISQANRCLSPSDFGFHNALLTEDGRLHFFDFEYAGWDDPAKLACDFFCQPQTPVGFEHWDWFVQSLTEGLGGDATLPVRARLLLPAYQIKWCCIILNHFVKAGRARREFARGEATAADTATQLEKARRLLGSLRTF